MTKAPSETSRSSCPQNYNLQNKDIVVKDDNSARNDAISHIETVTDTRNDSIEQAEPTSESSETN